jgi:hypothetical protein
LLPSRRIVQYVKNQEVDLSFRKKLFRSQATASARLGKQDKFIGAAFHCRNARLTNDPLAANLSIGGAGFKRENRASIGAEIKTQPLTNPP